MAFSLKDYQITEEIGRGGFASVYRARQKSLSREVAIKCLSPQRAQNDGDIIRFRREAEAMASLTHDNIVTIYDYAYCNGSYYIVMEFIDGPALDKAIEGGIPKDCALVVLEKVTGALRYAHTENIIHRDIKPANILLGRNGQVKLADFGLALFQTGIESYSSPTSVLGTISYMAPEALVSPKEVDARIDVFSLGCLLYQACSGNLPFRGSSFGEISFHLLNSEPEPLAETGTFQSLAAIAMRCLQKDRDKRPSINEIHHALKEALSDRYHAVQEETVSFVRNMPLNASMVSAKPADPFQNAPVAAAPGKRKIPASRRIAIAVGLCLLGAAVFLYFQLMGSGKTAKIPPLPELPQFPQNSALSEAARNTPFQNADRTLATDGPAPLAATAPGMDVARLVFEGLLPDDSVFINTALKQPRQGIIKLAPGIYRLDIRRKVGAPVVKELELLPYERRVVNLRK
jgi:serine/threonine-protein kinase